MKANSIDHLIDSLSRELNKEKPLSPLLFTAVVYTLAITTLSLGIISYIQPFRPGWMEDLQSARFLIETLFITVCVFTSALIGVGLSLPGSSIFKLKKIGWTPFALLTLSLLYGWLDTPALERGSMGARSACHLEVFFISLIPIIWSLLWLKKSFPGPFKVISTLYLAMAACAPSLAIMQLACMYDPRHNFLYHLLPACLAKALALTISQRIICNE